jgi:hypothetical protein
MTARPTQPRSFSSSMSARDLGKSLDRIEAVNKPKAA